MALNLACSEFCEPSWRTAIEKMVHDAVTGFKRHGLKIDGAIEQASLALGISQRSAFSIYYGQPIALTEAHYRAILDRFLLHLDAQAADLDHRAAEIRARRQQLEMDV